MSMLTFRVSDLLKSRMKEHSEINWSRFIRDQVERKLELTNRKKVGMAVKMQMEVLRDQNSMRSDTTELIRKYRDSR